jgi:hypothetical protein
MSTGTLEETKGLEALRRSPMMERLLGALEAGTDIGHYGRLVFAMVGRHFLDEDTAVGLLSRQPDQDEEKARALLLQCQAHDYSPPSREKIRQWQAQQDYQILPDDDPDHGNLYRDLRFPEDVYEHIQEYYEEKATA